MVGEPGQYTLLACSSCSAQFWVPLVHPGAAFYEDDKVDLYRELHEGRRSVRDPRFERFFEEFSELRGKLCLDIGCSDGTFLEQLVGRGNQGCGIDIDERALRLARDRGLDVMRSEADPFLEACAADGRRFDLVTAFDVIEHLTDPVGTVSRIRAVLNPGGIFVGTVPNRGRWFVNQMPIDFPPHHFFRHDRASLRALFQRSGMDVRRIDVFQYNYAAMVALDYVRKRLRRGAPSARASGGAGGPRRPAIGGVVAGLLGPLSSAVERLGNRGFKLYFVTSPARGS